MAYDKSDVFAIANREKEDLETCVCERLALFAKKFTEVNKTTGRSLHTYRNQVYDDLFGTDIMLEYVDPVPDIHRFYRVDITSDFNNKDNMPLITPPEYEILKIGSTGAYIRMGIRIGNGWYGFANPVIVVGVENYEYGKDETAMKRRAAINAELTSNRNLFTIFKAVYSTVESMRILSSDEDKKLPIPLDVNERYVNDEIEHIARRERRGLEGRYCLAAILTPDNKIRLDYTGRTELMLTDIPWMTPAGAMALKAASNAKGAQNEDIANALYRIAAQPVSDKPTSGPIFANYYMEQISGEKTDFIDSEMTSTLLSLDSEGIDLPRMTTRDDYP